MPSARCGWSAAAHRSGTSTRRGSARWGFRPAENWSRRSPRRFDAGQAGAADAIERQPSRPAFQALIYPGRSVDIQPTKDSPPAFLAAAYNDRQDIAEGLAEVYLRFKRAGAPAELHMYSTGGHGFGLRPPTRSRSAAGSCDSRSGCQRVAC